MRHSTAYTLLLLWALLHAIGTTAQTTEGFIEMQGQAGSGDYAPFWLIANRHGLGSIEPSNGLMRAAITGSDYRQGRFRFSYGVDLVTAVNHNANFIIQQAYTDITYRSLFLSIGSKERGGSFKNPLLSSGNFAWSGNARPIPQFRAGFRDWVTPIKSFDWFRLKGDLSWGWFTDGNYQEETVNRMNGTTMTGMGYHHKGVYFSFGRPKGRFRLEAGYEIDIQFGGIYTEYKDGAIVKQKGHSLTLKDFINSFIPRQGSSTYYEGNYVGSWQLKGSYRLNSESTLSACLETIFDDASGMGRANRFDGLYHIEYLRTGKRLITGALIEYFQSTHQSGPLHWMPQDNPNPTNIQHSIAGADNYYNNEGTWSHWGQVLGNPFITSPAYNKNGWMLVMNNRVKAIHGGVNGWITPRLEHRILASYIRGWGTPFIPYTEVKESFSALAEINAHIDNPLISSIKLSVAFDTGSLYGDNVAANLSIKKQF